MSSAKFIFEEALEESLRLNQECLALSNKLESMVEVVSEGEVEVTVPEKLTFHAISKKEDEKYFLLKLEGETQRLRLKKLTQFFEEFENPLKTSLPVYHYFDLSKDLQVYSLLKRKKSLHLITAVRDGLREVKDTLKEQLQTLENKVGLKSSLLESLGGKKQSFFKVLEDPYSKNVSLRFEIILTHERALIEFEAYQKLLSQQFERVESEDQSLKLQKRYEQEIEKVKLETELLQSNSQLYVFPDYQTDKLVEKDLYFSNNNWLISGRCKPTKGSTLKDCMLFGQDRSCYGASQFRLMVVSENYIAFYYGHQVSVRAEPKRKYPNGAQHTDGNGYVSELESLTPLDVDEWNEFQLEKNSDRFTLTLNGKSQSVDVLGLSKTRYPPIVPFRVGSRYPPNGESLDHPFRGEIKDFRIRMNPL